MKKEKKKFLTSKKLNFTVLTTIFISIFQNLVYADGGEAITKAQSLLSKTAVAGGGLWAVWGLVTLGMAIKDHNGPSIGGAIWQIIGGGMIVAAGAIISSLNLSLSA